MVRVITQETFDDVVKENMDEFGMDREEAVKEAQEQFKSQGVNLSNIVINSSSEHAVVTALNALTSRDRGTSIKEQCTVIRVECSKGLAERVLATKNDAYNILVGLALEAANDDEEQQRASVAALAALLDTNPDPLEEKGFQVIVQGLSNPHQTEMVTATLDMALSACVCHEHNRQNLVRNRLLNCLDTVFTSHSVQVARLWQALVQDDDVRVPFGKAHDHAREIVEEHGALEKLVDSIKGNMYSDSVDLALLLGCLSSLAVRNEYCHTVVDKGGLSCILELLMSPDQKVSIIKAALTLIKTLAGNDNVKKDIRATEGVGVIVETISRHMGSKAICHTGCAAISAICLRTPENAQIVMEANGAQILVQVLNTHMNNETVLIAAASAIRNIVSRTKRFSDEFVELDVETLLNEVVKRHPAAEEGVKAALRDLELKVHLKEEWTGTSSHMIRGD